MRMIPVVLVLFALGCSGPLGAEAVAPGADRRGGVILVTASYPGANAPTVVDTVAGPIEEQVNGVEGMTRMESEARDDGSYTLTVRFKPGTDLDLAQLLVQNRVHLAMPVLPELCTAQKVKVRKAPAGPPTFWVACTTANEPDINHYLPDELRSSLVDEFARLPGVADVRLVGAGVLVLRLWLDPEKLAARELTLADVVKAVDHPSLRVTTDSTAPRKGAPLRCTVTLTGRLSDTDSATFGKIILKANAEGEIVRLNDVARVELDREWAGFATKNGEPAVLLALTAWPGKTTAEDVRKTARTLRKNLPDSIQLELVADLSAAGVAVVDVRLPGAASREHTRKVIGQATRLIRALPGSPDCTAYGSDRESNVATILVRLPEKGPPTTASVRDRLNKEIPAARFRVGGVSAGGEPFPVRIAVCDTGQHGFPALREVADEAAKQLAADTGVTEVAVSPGPSVPKVVISLDQKKLRVTRVSADDVMSAVRVLTGTNDEGFDPDRTGIIQIAAGPRARPDDLTALKIRSAKGEMVPLGAIADVRSVPAETGVTRVNLYPALILTANPPDGTTPADAAARCLKRVEKDLPKGYRAENLTRPAR